MKKHSRLISLLLAVGVLFSLMIPASATECSEETELSRFAGSVKPCIIVESFSDSRPDIIREINIPIPAMATKAAEERLVAAAVNEATGITGANSYQASQMGTYGISPGGVNYPGDVLFSEDGPFNFASVPITMRVAAGRLQENYSTIYITFADMTPGPNASKFHVKIGNDHHTGGSVYKTQSINIALDGTTTIWMLHGSTYGDGTLRLRSGDNITVWGAVDAGSFFVRNVVVSLAR